MLERVPFDVAVSGLICVVESCKKETLKSPKRPKVVGFFFTEFLAEAQDQAFRVIVHGGTLELTSFQKLSSL